MIDPMNITDFTRDDSSLEEFWIFCICVAGKKASMIAEAVDRLLADRSAGTTPFSHLRELRDAGSLRAELVRARVGKYALLERSICAVLDQRPDLRTADPNEFEAIPGVGPKTSRFFILHSRPDAQVAVIDTHLTKLLRRMGHVVPKGPPTGRAYLRLEAIVLDLAKLSGLTLADFDLRVWRHYASRGEHPLPASVA